MKTKLCIELKDQDEINSLTELVSFYLDYNNDELLLPNAFASDLRVQLEKFKKDI